MGKNELVLSASPRRGGNSDTLCDEFIRGAKESGNEAEKVFLRDKKINYCTGCSACFVTHQCVQKDDMAEILDKMIQADVLVLATSVYFFAMDAQMKTLIDRTAPRYAEISNKDFYFIVTSENADKALLERVIEGFRGFTYCLEGAHEKGVVYGAGVWKAGEVRSTGAMREAYEMGRSV